VSISGFGYWSGEDVNVEFRPAEADAGIVFVRSDYDTPVWIPARIENRIEIPRRTSLSRDGASVEMIEHIMAALAGLQIDNCEVWVDRTEMPGCDGSSAAMVEALDQVKIIQLDAYRSQLIINEVTRVGDDDCWIEARPGKGRKLSIKYRLDYGSDSPIGRETIQLNVTPSSFRKELATARTFLLEEEADWLRAQGKGMRVTHQDLVIFGDEGPIDNELRFEDECVRHKMLDLVGDLALAPCDLAGHFIAHCAGHRLHAELLRALLAEGQIIEGRRHSA